MRHPLQPIGPDAHGRPRFKENAIVQYLLDNGPFDMNMLAVMDFPVDDREQFAQLIGYSLDGFGSLSYVREETYTAAATMADGGLSEQEARIRTLEEMLENARQGLRIAAPALFRIHPEALEP